MGSVRVVGSSELAVRDTWPSELPSREFLHGDLGRLADLDEGRALLGNVHHDAQHVDLRHRETAACCR